MAGAAAALLVTATLCSTLVGTALAICPQECVCSLDSKGRRQVVCSRGGMSDHIPIQTMDPHVEVLKISAPADNPNYLTIGPIFQGFSQLEELRIVRSNVPAIGRHSFWGVQTLRVLDLSHNNVSQALDYNFRGLANLIELRLDDNRIESLPSGTFRYLQELRVLSLSRNRIKELVPRLFLMLSKLQELDLSANRLSELNPEVFKDVQDLKVFRCRGCGLSNINSLIYQLLPDLTYLDLGNNEFKYVDSDEFRNLRRLQVLRLDGNQLPVVLEKTFSGSPIDGHLDLHTIDLARNRLAIVTTTAFANLSTLRHLDLSYNKLDKLDPMTFLPMTDSLRSLNISGNAIPLSEVKYVLQVLPKLRDLSLADMGLSELPIDLFGYHEHIKMLNLSRNHFTHLPAQKLSAIPKLYELDISRNRFRGIDDRLLSRLETVKRVHLRGNLWVCDLCHMMPILSRVNKTVSSWSDIDQLRCAAPQSLKGRYVHSLRASSLERCIVGDTGLGYMEGGSSSRLPENSRMGFIAAGIAVLLLLLVGSALLAWLAYSRHHAAHYYTREEARGPEREAIFENPAAVLGENGEIKYKIVAMDPAADVDNPPPQKKKKKTVTICTIDSIAKDPELRTLTNGT